MRSRSDGAAVAREYLEALEHQRRLSPATLRNYARALDLLLKETHSPESLEPSQVRRLIAVLHAKGASPRTLALTLSAWRGYYRWLARHRNLRANPVLGIRAPKAARPLPKALSVEAAQRLLDGELEEKSPLTLQDAAMFELLYSSGLRVGELTALNLSDEPDKGEVTVTGKGSKTRTVPVGAKARDALKRWLSLRDKIAAPHEKALFVGARGKRISPSRVWQRLTRWAKRRGLAENVHPHMLRHSFASHMLQSSQDLRAVQEMLGHASISTTQVYTHLDFQALAKIYDAAHPRARKK
ncbi:MAG TPA: tyrosine recombinase XerC [Burkholderiales bacterium]|nr:tyrosine recombinase XerC [Burkholderiales bacterium]